MISLIFDIEGKDSFLEEKKYSFRDTASLSAFIRNLNRSKINRTKPIIMTDYDDSDEEFLYDEY